MRVARGQASRGVGEWWCVSSTAGVGVVVGVGPREGTGSAVARRIAAEGRHVFVAGRTLERLETCVDEIRNGGGEATAIATDTTDVKSVAALFAAVDATGLPLEIAVYNAGNARWGKLLELDVEAFEETWRVGCLGGFIVGQEAGRRMLERGDGSILFTGAT